MASVKYEYLDHTADIQIHSWGKDLSEAFEQAALAMFNYMVELDKVEVDNSIPPREIEAEGHDMDSLLFQFMDEFLFVFCTEWLVCTEITITEFDKENFKIKAHGKGEKLDKKKHTTGTEVKAITYSAMQIRDEPGKAEIYIIVDI